MAMTFTWSSCKRSFIKDPNNAELFRINNKTPYLLSHNPKWTLPIVWSFLSFLPHSLLLHTYTHKLLKHKWHSLAHIVVRKQLLTIVSLICLKKKKWIFKFIPSYCTQAVRLKLLKFILKYVFLGRRRCVTFVCFCFKKTKSKNCH